MHEAEQLQQTPQARAVHHGLTVRPGHVRVASWRTHCALRHALLSICSSIAHNGTHRHAPQHAPLVALLNCAYLGDTLLLGMRTLLGMRCTRPKGARTLLHPPRCSGACYSTHAPNYASGCACLGGALLQSMRARS